LFGGIGKFLVFVIFGEQRLFGVVIRVDIEYLLTALLLFFYGVEVVVINSAYPFLVVLIRHFESLAHRILQVEGVLRSVEHTLVL